MTTTKKDKIQLIVIATAVLAMMLYMPRLLERNRAQENRSLPSAGTAETPVPASPLSDLFAGSLFNKEDLAETEREQRRRANQPWIRDPFFALPLDSGAQPVESSASHLGELVLMGISLKGERAMAIVNHTVIGEGDEVNGLKVIRIEKDRVTFIKDGEDVVLRYGGVR